MKYIVVECHFSYAVVLDEEGRYLKVANMRYEVGQRVTNVIEMQEDDLIMVEEKPVKRKNYKWFSGLVAIAACLALVTTSLLQMGQMAYASVYMKINPEVRIDVNKKEQVVNLEGVNEDGKELISDYSFKGKKLEQVMDELVDRAIEKGFLSEGGEVTLMFDAKDQEWIVKKSNSVKSHLNEYLENKFSVNVEVETKKQNKENTQKESQEVIIPVSPNENDSTYDESDYGDAGSDYEESDHEDDQEAIIPVSPNENDSTYDESDYEGAGSDYEESDYEDEESDYED